MPETVISAVSNRSICLASPSAYSRVSGLTPEEALTSFTVSDAYR